MTDRDWLAALCLALEDAAYALDAVGDYNAADRARGVVERCKEAAIETRVVRDPALD